jgi:glucose-6-phosphate isomerase
MMNPHNTEIITGLSLAGIIPCMTKTLTKKLSNIDNAVALHQADYDQLLSSLEAKFKEVQNNLVTANGAKPLEYYKWLDFDYLLEANQETKALAKAMLAKNYQHYLIVGMGGSGINSLVLQNSLNEFTPSGNKFTVQNNLDPSSLLARLDSIDLDSTLFVFISKSGTTDEVRRNVATILDHWDRHPAKQSFASDVDTKEVGTVQSTSSTNGDSCREESQNCHAKFAAQSVFITEPAREGKKNFLHDLRTELKAKTGTEPPFLANDPNIGGRFSMFSPVGMFTAELMGLDSDAMIKAAADVFEDFKAAQSIQESEAAKIAALDILLTQKGLQNRYSMVYADSFEALNKFRAQLKGESLNKTGVASTIQVPGVGTANHHSDLELLFKKDNKLVLEQIYWGKPAQDHVNSKSLDCLDDLVGQSNHQSLIDNHIIALGKYLIDNKAVVIQTIIPEQNEKYLSQFCMQDMLITIVQGGLQDPVGSSTILDLVIRQEEVERYKKSLKK